ncbi:MAG: bifunctional nuclease family protein [Chloroflexi bacterium]|nr:bifunctional nuclease family protein [Chloroflexota bacterium]
MDDELIEMVVESVRIHMLSSRHVVILKEQGRERYLPIWIGPWEASAIAMRLQGLTPERPLTHDLFANALEALEARVARVVISELADETFHARLFVERDGHVGEVDARPSDALALAVRVGAPIFAMPSVLDQAALGADTSLGEEGEAGLLETTGEGGVDPRLDVFRQFVNSLDVDPDAEGRAKR